MGATSLVKVTSPGAVVGSARRAKGAAMPATAARSNPIHGVHFQRLFFPPSIAHTPCKCRVKGFLPAGYRSVRDVSNQTSGVRLIWQSRRRLLLQTAVNAGTSSEVDVRLSCVMLRGTQHV